MAAIQVAVVDDNKHIRELIYEILKLEEDIHVCGEAENMDAARILIGECRPDITILDISLNEDRGGLMLLKEMPSLSPRTRTIILSAHDAHLYADRCLQAGAKGYICKDKAVHSLADAIRAVHDGSEFVSSDTF